MKALALVVLLGMIAITLATCQDDFFCPPKPPKTPEWPSMYSAHVEWRANHRPHHKHFRLFWDEKHNRARTGAMVEWKGKHYKMEALFCGDKHKAYYVFYDHDQVKCFHKDTKMNITGIDLDDADFQGTSVVEYHPVYHWEKVLEKKGEKAHLRLFDTQEDREIKKIGYYLPESGKAGTMTFHEMNYGSQGHSLFKLPKLVRDHCNEKLDVEAFLDIDDPVALLAHLAESS
jgi:hypothetical protein